MELIKQLVLAASRPEGWFEPGDRVVMLDLNKEKLRLLGGKIHSTQGEQIVVQCDRMFDETAKSGEDAYKRSFNADDPHLLKPEEARALRGASAVALWFSVVDPPLSGRAQDVAALLSVGPLPVCGAKG